MRPLPAHENLSLPTHFFPSPSRPSAGWHWQEKDCLEWARGRLGELLAALPLAEGTGAIWAKTAGVEAVTGEAYVNRRKGKLIPGYELDIKVRLR